MYMYMYVHIHVHVYVCTCTCICMYLMLCVLMCDTVYNVQCTYTIVTVLAGHLYLKAICFVIPSTVLPKQSVCNLSCPCILVATRSTVVRFEMLHVWFSVLILMGKTVLVVTCTCTLHMYTFTHVFIYCILLPLLFFCDDCNYSGICSGACN